MSAQLGAYEFDTMLGRGGMGHVFGGVHRVTGHGVALKVLRDDRADDVMRRAFRVEVEAIARLQHPCVIRVHDHGALPAPLDLGTGLLAPGTPYIVMDRVDGVTLRALGRLSWSDLRPILCGVLRALAATHARGVIHRDLKPENILIRNGEPVLIDFGVATLRGASTIQGGTPIYMAPEQLVEHPHGQGPWTDLYALATLAYECWTGTLPYLGATREALLEARLAGRRASWPAGVMDSGVRAWLERGLAQEPALRFSCAAHALESLQNVSPTTSHVTPTSSTTSALFSLTTDYAMTPTPERVEPAPRRAERMAVPALPEFARQGPAPLPGAGLGLVGLRVAPMLGRARERERLWRALQTPTGHAIGYEGFAGVGKSRLARWLCRSAHEVAGVPHVWASFEDGLDARVSWSRAWDDVLGLAADAPRDRVRARLISRLGVASTMTQPLSELMRPGERAVTSDDVAGRVLAQTLDALADAGPVILVLDDLHWGRDASWWLDPLATLLETRPILVLATAREESMQEDTSRRESWDRALSALDAERTPLGALEDHEHRALVTSVLSWRPEVVDQILALTRGNPLHTLQLLGDWISRDLVETHAQGFAPKEEALSGVPASIQEVCRTRIDNVTRSEEALAVVLERASLLGISLSWSEWEELAREDADAWLARITRAGLAERTREGWRFVHGLLRESLQAQCREQGRWVEANAACSDILEPGFFDSTLLSRRLYPHALEAGQWLRAVEAWYSAQFGWDYEFVNRGLARLEARLPEDVEPAVRVVLLLSRAKIATHAGSLEQSESLLEEAERRVEPGSRLHQRVLLSKVENTVFCYRVEEGLALIERLESIPNKDSRIMINFHSYKGELLQHARRFDEAVASLRTALSIARFEHEGHVAWTTYLLASALADAGEWEETLPLLEESERRFEDSGDLVGTGSVALVRASHAMLTKDLPLEMRCYEEALRAFEFIGDAGASIALENLVRAHLRLGQWELARDHHDRLLQSIEDGTAFDTFARDIEMGLALASGDTPTFDNMAATFTDDVEQDMWAREDVALCVWGTALEASARGDVVRARVALGVLSRIRAELGVEQSLDADAISNLTRTLMEGR